MQTQVSGDLLLEDHVTALAQDAAGRICVGHRSKGMEVLDPQTLRRVYPTGKDPASDDYVFSLLPAMEGQMPVGKYGGGLSALNAGAKPSALHEPVASASLAGSAPAAFPSPAKSPSPASPQALRRQIQSFKTDIPETGAFYLGDDWRTQGDGLGHYGRIYAHFCAIDLVVTCTDAYWASGIMGPRHYQGDGIRWWVTWMQTDNSRCQYSPEAGTRRQAEWDDHGEAYPMTYEGPDIWGKVTSNVGDLHRLSLYFMNKDGHDGENRYRDYVIEVRPYLSDIAAAEKTPCLARARVVNFWGGVYKQFVISTPGVYWVKIAKNNSHNTILSAVMIDKLVGKKFFTDTEPMAYMNHVPYDPPTLQAQAASPGQASDRHLPVNLTAAQSLWTTLDGIYPKTQGLPLQWTYRVLAYRAALRADAGSDLLANWRWNLCLWDASDRQQFDATMSAAWQAGSAQRTATTH